MKFGFGEDRLTDQSIVFSTKEHAEASGIDLATAHSFRVVVVSEFPDLIVDITTMGEWVMIDVKDPVVPMKTDKI